MADLEVDLHYTAGDFDLEVSLALSGPVAVVGPNGAGKSTLLRLLAGGLVPEAGRIQVCGRVWVDTERFLSPRARRVGFLPQGRALFPHLDARGNVAFGLDEPAQADRLLAQVGAGHLARRRPQTLSGGEQQRVALARALGADPELLLLDEPTAALDVEGRRDIRALLASLVGESRRLAVIVTHDLRDLAALEPTVVYLRAGRVVSTGPASELPSDPFLDELLGPLRDGSGRLSRRPAAAVLPAGPRTRQSS